MENVSDINKIASIKSLQSTIDKSEKALARMVGKDSSTTLLKKRLEALYTGLYVLESAWNQKPHHFKQYNLAEARNTLSDLHSIIKVAYIKAKNGSPQRTLLERRIKAIELAIQAIDDLSE